MNIYYDFSKLDEFFGVAPSEQIEILSEKELQEQGIVKPIEGDWSGPDHPRYVDGRCYNLSRKEYVKQHYEKNKEKRQTQKRQWYQKNKEKILEQTKQYRLDNIDKIKEYERLYRLKKKHPCMCMFTGMVY